MFPALSWLPTCQHEHHPPPTPLIPQPLIGECPRCLSPSPTSARYVPVCDRDAPQPMSGSEELNTSRWYSFYGDAGRRLPRAPPGYERCRTTRTHQPSPSEHCHSQHVHPAFHPRVIFKHPIPSSPTHSPPISTPLQPYTGAGRRTPAGSRRPTRQSGRRRAKALSAFRLECTTVRGAR